MNPSLRIRRWFTPSASGHSDAPPKFVAAGWELARRFRPQVLLLEDRNAPSSLLDALFADALAAAVLPPETDRDRRRFDDDPLRDVIRIAAGDTVAEPTAPPVTLRGGDDMLTAPSGVVTIGTADESAFFWLPDATLSSQRLGDGSGDAVSDIVTSSTGNGIGVRVTATRFASYEQNGTLDTASPAIGFVPTVTDAAPGSSAGQDDGARFRVQNEIEPDEDAPPNTAPIAVDDTANVDEDGSVVIDVVANDTDEDNDSLWVDGWDAEPANGTLIRNEDGTVTYTPFKNFHGTDSLTYNVTDGRDTATATITITVAPVNDAPRAFNDGFEYRNEVADGNPVWPAGVPYPYVPTEGWSVLPNDIDLEGSTLTVAALDFTGTVGTVTVNATTGGVYWEGPWDFVGQSSFRYRVQDAGGAISDWATAWMWVYEPVGQAVDQKGGGKQPPPVAVATAGEDLVPQGDHAGSGSVMDNDTDGYIAVVATHPSSARLSTFGFDGKFDFEPGMPRVDDIFTYRLFGPAGTLSVFAAVQMPVVDLVIHHGQGGKAVRDEDEEVRGAYTVANRNDTDGDAVIDNVDTAGVRAAHGVGGDEKDLMRLVVRRPAVFPAGAQLTVNVTSEDARIYTNQYREGKSETSLTLTTNSFTVENTATYWVEAFNPSGKVRDIAIEMKYGNASDTVQATSVWANFAMPTDLRTSGRDLAPEADDKQYINSFTGANPNANGPWPDIGLGQQPPHVVEVAQGKKLMVLANAIEFRFTIQPAGLNDPTVQFDIARTIERKSGGGIAGSRPFVHNPAKYPAVVFPAFREAANDDINPDDEDITPTFNRIFSMDHPGARVILTDEQIENKQLFSVITRHYQHINAHEFVRIMFDGGKFDHTPEFQGKVQGSRVSEYVDWRSWVDFTWDSKQLAWVRTPDVQGQELHNFIGPGHSNVALPNDFPS